MSVVLFCVIGWLGAASTENLPFEKKNFDKPVFRCYKTAHDGSRRGLRRRGRHRSCKRCLTGCRNQRHKASRISTANQMLIRCLHRPRDADLSSAISLTKLDNLISKTMERRCIWLAALIRSLIAVSIQDRGNEDLGEVTFGARRIDVCRSLVLDRA